MTNNGLSTWFLFGLTGIGTALTSVAGAQAQEPPIRSLPGPEAQRDLEILREAVEVIHPGLGRYVPATAFEEEWALLHSAAGDGISDHELYLQVSLLLAGLRCGHTRVEAPESVDAWRAENPSQLPFHFRLIDGRMFVEMSPELERGTEVLKIDGLAVADLIEKLAPTVPVDGFVDSIRPSRLQASYEYRDSGLDHYLPYVTSFRSEFQLEILPVGAETPQLVTVAAINSKEWEALAPEAGWQDFRDAVSWRSADERTAVLEVGTFVNYRRPVDPEATFARIFEELRNSGAEHLVLDLRSCGGGSSDVGWTLARFLIDRPITVGGPSRLKNIRFGELVPHLSSWVENAFEQPEEMFRRTEEGWYELRTSQSTTLTPHPMRFPGRITALIGPYNASGATMLLAALKEAQAVRLVGEPTGGSAEGPTAGLLFYLTLPNSGIRVNVPVFRETTGLKSFEVGRGVTPDVLVRPSVADFLADRDPVLEAALGQE